MKTVIDGFTLFSWVFYDDLETLHDNMKDHYEGIFFNGNKVLKLEKASDSAWF